MHRTRIEDPGGDCIAGMAHYMQALLQHNSLTICLGSTSERASFIVSQDGQGFNVKVAK